MVSDLSYGHERSNSQAKEEVQKTNPEGQSASRKQYDGVLDSSQIKEPVEEKGESLIGKSANKNEDDYSKVSRNWEIRRSMALR